MLKYVKILPCKTMRIPEYFLTPFSFWGHPSCHNVLNCHFILFGGASWVSWVLYGIMGIMDRPQVVHRKHLLQMTMIVTPPPWHGKTPSTVVTSESIQTRFWSRKPACVFVGTQDPSMVISCPKISCLSDLDPLGDDGDDQKRGIF